MTFKRTTWEIISIESMIKKISDLRNKILKKYSFIFVVISMRIKEQEINF